MAIDIDDLPTTQRTIAGYFRNRLSDWGLGPRAFLGKLKDALALSVYGILRAVKLVDNDIVPSDKTSTQGLDDHAYTFGLDDGDGGYGRRGATVATGGVGFCTGVNGTTFTDGLTLTASDGTTKILLDGTVTITVGTSVEGAFVAQTEGIAGNLAEDEVLTWDSPPVGADSTVTLTTALSGGLDEEDNDGVLDRLGERLQQPPKGGAAIDYKTWALAGSDNVSRAYVYPRRYGTGTVDVVITQAGTGTSRAPSASTEALVQAEIDEQRPVTVESARVHLPNMPGANGLDIRARVTPNDGFEFDWDDTVGYTVNAVNAGAKTIQFNTLAPASLKAAIDADELPRVTVKVTTSGFPVIPEALRAVSYVDGGGMTTVTFEAWYTSPNPDPTVGDSIFSGGPAAETVSDDLLDYVDSLGPSKSSGFHDANDDWDDTCRVDQLIRVALDSLDEDGETRLLKDFVTDPTIGGAATNVTASDNDVTIGPELLYAKRILVTQ